MDRMVLNRPLLPITYYLSVYCLLSITYCLYLIPFTALR